ncbi:activator of HSP90 ATPase [Acrocarpospora corrugata]|uniref:Activator of HSP90 ATPase n=1 Tax=Acrocarpospora corrugata TaxID=35763 RepID=A0A5M3WFB5_9ACTN|nr:SRPBCC family protein [Acrocarpospora corrugata]GES05833.1 activator of HSP90 ATPase [Acrocarpospora corrugata]
MDIVDEIARAQREVSGGTRQTVLVRRTYDAEITDVWAACTEPERLRRWFLPVSGDLRVGGTYQIEGNAGGEILRCEPPELFTVTWLFGENPGFSEVEVRLSADGDGTLFELRHTAEMPTDMWSKYGPGATGVGWDLTLLGLSLHLLDGDSAMPDEATFHQTDEGRRFITASSHAWGAAHLAAGTPPDQVAAAVANTTAFYAPE